MTPLRFAAIVLLTVAVTRPCVAEGKPTKFLTHREMLDLMEASSVTYEVKAGPVDTVEAERRFWPPARPPIGSPKRYVRPDGKIEVREHEAGAASAAIRGGEALFKIRNWSLARARYEEAAVANPNFPEAPLLVGDTWFMEEKYVEAEQAFRRAIALEPYLPMAWHFLADALQHSGKPAEAREAYTRSLTLLPRQGLLLDKVRRAGRDLRVTVREETLRPRVIIRHRPTGFEITFDPGGGGHWLMYGMCKALWLGETKHRKDITGSTSPGWSTAEELECLGALLNAYRNGRNRGETARDPAIDTLSTLVEEGNATAFVLYEIGARFDPQIVLRASDDTIRRVEDYVRRFVLIPYE